MAGPFPTVRQSTELPRSKPVISFRLLELPPEVREQIYYTILCHSHDETLQKKSPQALTCIFIQSQQPYRSSPRISSSINYHILLANKQVHAEASRVLYDNLTIAFETNRSIELFLTRYPQLKLSCIRRVRLPLRFWSPIATEIDGEWTTSDAIFDSWKRLSEQLPGLREVSIEMSVWERGSADDAADLWFEQIVRMSRLWSKQVGLEFFAKEGAWEQEDISAALTERLNKWTTATRSESG